MFLLRFYLALFPRSLLRRLRLGAWELLCSLALLLLVLREMQLGF